MNNNKFKYDEEYLAKKLNEANKIWLEFVSKYLFASDIHKEADRYMLE